VRDEVEMRVLALSVVLWGCSGKNKDDDSAPDASCDDIVTERLGSVAATEWPAGLAEAVPTYNDTGGRWTATSSCGGEIAVKFTRVSQEDLLVVREPWTTTNLPCGCITDPNHPDDTAFDVVALHENYAFYVESFDDPALNAQTIVSSGALYGPGEPLQFRACGFDNVDPYLQSRYDQITTVVRVDAGGVMSGTLVLAPIDGPVETCELTGFVLVEAQI
jgi:hypothetical protein